VHGDGAIGSAAEWVKFSLDAPPQVERGGFPSTIYAMKTAKASSRRPARQASLKPSHLNRYLAGAAGTAALLGAPQAEAALTAVTFGFGPSYNLSDTNGNINWAVNGGTFGYLRGNLNGNYLSLGGDNVGAVYHNGHFGSSSGLMSFFANSTVIGLGTNGPNFNYAFAQANGIPGLDFTSDQLNKNIGFKTSTNNFGWANVSWTEADKTLTINEAYVESVAGTPITIAAPAVPEPSRALLALAGLATVALRRRRKQAA
jgi:hypothetical protein